MGLSQRGKASNRKDRHVTERHDLLLISQASHTEKGHINTIDYLPSEVFDLIQTIDYLTPEVFDLIQTIDYLPPQKIWTANPFLFG